MLEFDAIELPAEAEGLRGEVRSFLEANAGLIGQPNSDFRHKVIRSIYEEGDHLRVSSYGGWNVLDKKSGL